MRTFTTLGALLTALAVTLGQVEPRGENPAIRVNTLLGPTGLITVPTSTTTPWSGSNSVPQLGTQAKVIYFSTTYGLSF